MNLKIYFILFALLSSLKCELRLVFEMFRHGARAPYESLDENNTDIFGEKWEGSSELTGIGMRQHFLLGLKNRIKYSKFISEKYDPKEIFIMSTDTNRTIMSVNAQLQGFYPPGTGPILNRKQQNIALPPSDSFDFSIVKEFLNENALPNQMGVFPVHIIDKKAHKFYLHDPDVCPVIVDIMKENRKKPASIQKVIDFNTTYGEIFKKALKLPDFKYLTDYGNVQKLCDTYIANFFDQRELKILTDAGLNLTQFNESAYDFNFYDMYEVGLWESNNLIGLSSMSPTMISLTQWMDKRIKDDINGLNYTSTSPKMVLLSGHDSNLAALLIYLKVVFDLKEYRQVPYASNIFFELHKGINNETLPENNYYVKIIFNGSPILSPTIPYSEFKKNIIDKSMNATQIQKFCGWKTGELSFSETNSSILLFTFFLSMICIVLLSVVGYNCYKKSTQRMDNPFRKFNEFTAL